MSVAYGRAYGKAHKFSVALRKWAWEISSFREHGLYHDDALHQDEIVEKALKRIPEEVRNERNFRIIRAIQLDVQNKILPKEEWTTWEDDQKNRYLWKAIHDVVKEIDEEKEWQSNK